MRRKFKYKPGIDFPVDPEDIIKLRGLGLSPDKAGYIVCGSDPYLNLTLHRILYNLYNVDIPAGMVVDHINEINRDNRKCNLRILTHGENIRRSKPLTPWFDNTYGRWKVKYRIPTGTKNVSFKSLERALRFANQKNLEFAELCIVPTLQEIIDARNSKAKAD